jgi:hypothetical protein
MAIGVSAHFLVTAILISSVFAQRYHLPGSWGTVEGDMSPETLQATQAQQNVTCPPPGFQSLEPFSLKAYAGKQCSN